MSIQEERTTNVQTRDGKNDFALKAMSKHLPMHLCGFYIGDPYPHNAPHPKALTMLGLCKEVKKSAPIEGRRAMKYSILKIYSK
jgi:hypothetical protein